MTQVKFVQFPPIINGTYKKDTPNSEIGYQKWEVEVPYEVVYRYTITAKTKSEADEMLDKHQSSSEEIDEYGKTFRETIQSKVINDMQGDETKTWKKIEECIPREDTDIDTDQRFLNYEDPDWSKDDFEWYKNEDGTNIKKEAHGSTNT